MFILGLIGSGQLGSRHLQAIANIDLPIEIDVVDPSCESLKIAKVRFEELPKNPNVKRISFFNSINDLHSEIDLCIVATNSDVRAIVTEELLLKKKVKYLILEKILFQTENEYETIGNLIERYNVKTWVNCPRRMLSVYRQIRANLTNSHLYEINISGSSLDLASGSIHMIDLMAYLTGIDEYNINGDLLDPDVLESKRIGFLEVTGSLKGSFKDGPNFSISSFKDGKVPSIIQLISQKAIYFISEDSGMGWISSEDKKWAWQAFSFKIPYQSQLTHLIIKQIIDAGESDLPSFEESVKLHLPLLNCFISFLRREGNVVGDRCPIT